MMVFRFEKSLVRAAFGLAATLFTLAAAAPAFSLDARSGEAIPSATILEGRSLEVGIPQRLEAESAGGKAPLALPDLFVYTVQPVDVSHNAISTIVTGQAVYFKFAVANGGSGSCTDPSIYVEVLMDGSYLDGGVLNLTAVPPGSFTYVYTSTAWVATAGPHTARFTVDVNGEQPETNELNNSKDYVFTTGTSSGTSDLAIVNEIQPCDTSLNPISGVLSGQTVLFRFQVANLGTGYPTSTSVAITVTLDGAPLGGGNYNLTGLQPGYYVHVYSSFWTAEPGTHVVVATVDALNSQVELDESNNQKSYSFTVASSCGIACSASAPPTGLTGAAVAFAGSATLSGCAPGAVAYDWNYGDGSAHGSSQGASHTYSAAGTYGWEMTATSSGAGSCTQRGTIVVYASCVGPAITVQPQDLRIQPGNQTILTVETSGTSLVYQWYQGVSGDLAKPLGYATSSW